MTPYEIGRNAGDRDARNSIARGQLDMVARKLPADHTDARDWLIGYAAGIQLAARRYLGGAQA